MRLSDITLILGVDAKHLGELRWVWPTWMRFKPELREMPCIVFYDAKQVCPDAMPFLNQCLNIRFVPWEMPSALTQRERMLTGFVHVPAREIATPWYLKLDTDVVATGAGTWIKPEWFESDASGETPVFISAKWHYTKPRFVMDLLDHWGDGVPVLADRPRLNLPYSSASPKVQHPRIISWLFFGHTNWTRKVAALAAPDGRLPYPSQDSFMFYCAERMGVRYVRERMVDYHWTHKRFHRIRELVSQMGLKPA